MALRAVDPIGSDSESVSFELDLFEVDGDEGLRLRGRWFGIRGRRFVRPTLTMRIDGAKHRMLADLDHKPWAAEDGQEWVASFSPAPPAGEVTDIELAVAPDITVALAAPGSGRVSATVKRPASRAGAPARRAPRRKSPAEPAAEEARAETPEVGRPLEGATAPSARLVAERDVLVAERDRLRRERTVFRKKVRELQSQLKASQASAEAEFTETRTRLEDERAETDRLRAETDRLRAETDRLRAELVSFAAVLAGRDRVAGNLDTVIAERDRLAQELDTVTAERDRLAAQASEAPTVEPEGRPVGRERPARPASRAVANKHPRLKWVQRLFALIAMALVLLTVAVVLHLV